MGYVPPTPIDSYPTMPCSELMTPNEIRRTLCCSECAMDDVILYADNKVVASYSTVAKERDISKTKYTNCPNCGAPVTGPICEYCGLVLSNGEAERIKQFAKAKWLWEESVIQAELMRNILQRSQQQINYDLQSQICCDTRTQINNSIIQSPDYIPKPVPIVIDQEPIEDLSFSKVVIVFCWYYIFTVIGSSVCSIPRIKNIPHNRE